MIRKESDCERAPIVVLVTASHSRSALTRSSKSPARSRRHPAHHNHKPQRQQPPKCRPRRGHRFPIALNTRACPRGSACAASSASASKDSRAAASPTIATTSTALSRLRLNVDRHRLEAACPFRRRCRTRASRDEEVGPTAAPFKAARSISGWRSPTSATPRRRSAARLGRQELVFGEQRLRRPRRLGERRADVRRRRA